MNERKKATERFYLLLASLAPAIGGPKLLGDPGLSRSCPPAGLYFFFEPGEVRADGSPRVVRIGTHALRPTSKATLWG